MSSKFLRSSGSDSAWRMVSRAARRVQIVGLIGDRRAPKPLLRSDRQRVREIAIERIDGLDPQTRGTVIDAPAAPRRMRPHRRGELRA